MHLGGLKGDLKGGAGGRSPSGKKYLVYVGANPVSLHQAARTLLFNDLLLCVECLFI